MMHPHVVGLGLILCGITAMLTACISGGVPWEWIVGSLGAVFALTGFIVILD
jgi:hypothetical protein